MSPVARRAGAPDQRLGKRQRLIRPIEFDEAFSQNRKQVGRLMVLWLRAGEGAALRLGVVTSRKVGGAVQRARARRVLREAFRRSRHTFDGAVDVVLVARAPVVRAPWAEVTNELEALAAKAGILR